MDLNIFRQKYHARSPNLERLRSESETILLNRQHGLLLLTEAPMKNILPGKAPFDQSDRNGTNKYLWVIMTDNVPVVMEFGKAVSQLGIERATHTNLTGGKPAHCAGELWFKNETTIWLSGGSSRYRPENPVQLADAVAGFESWGYRVISFGWDEGTDQPARFYRG